MPPMRWAWPSVTSGAVAHACGSRPRWRTPAGRRQLRPARHGPDALGLAVASEDLTALMRVPGVGKKGAQRIVLELGDRLGAAGETGGAVPGPRSAGASPWRDQVRAGLMNLGWAARDA